MLKSMLGIGMLLVVACAQPVATNPDADTRSLILHWSELNSRCRGGFGNDPATWQACEERSEVSAQLETLGFCYGENDDFGYPMDWAVCTREFG